MATTEDFDQDAVGFIGDSSEITWLRRLIKEIGLSGDLDSFYTANYHIEYRGSAVPESLNTTHRPAYKVACRLFDRYAASVHVSFPVVDAEPFRQQFETYYQINGSPHQENPPPSLSHQWLAIFYLILAIGKRHHSLIGDSVSAELDEATPHNVYYERAMSFRSRCTTSCHSRVSQMQLDLAASLYLLSTGQVTR
jgi:hypothetical protein